LEELRHPGAPPLVRHWATTPPGWLIIHPDPDEPDKALAALDPGERTALRLSEQLGADVVLLDEAAARAFAVQHGLKVSGTLGVLCNAARAGSSNFPPPSTFSARPISAPHRSYGSRFTRGNLVTV
jgi:hypothetical protein